MPKVTLGSLAALLTAATLAQAQGASPYPPAYPPYGYAPPQYGYAPPQYGYAPPQYMPYPGGYPMYGPPAYAAASAYPAYPQPASTSEPEATAPAPKERGKAAAAAAGPHESEPYDSPVLHDFQAHEYPCLRYWLSLEYLYWFASPGPGAPPLISTGPAADARPGAIGQPGTQVLFGGGDIALPGAIGMRMTVGAWVDEDLKYGLEYSGFVFENAASHYYNNVTSVLAVPINVVGPNAALNGRNAVPIQNPAAATNPLNGTTSGPYVGSVSAELSSMLWGEEITGYINLFRCRGVSLDFLGGFRYANLQEVLALNDSSTSGIITNNYHDNFHSGNQFVGGQVGLRGEFDYCRLSLAATLKVAAGVNFEEMNVSGSTTQSVGGASSTYSGGIFAQPSNIGTQHHDIVSALPSMNFKIGYDFTPNVRVFVGYDFLYWANVLRATNQIDGNINPSQAFGGTLVGSNSPAALLNQSNYYAQGFNLGVQFRW